MAILVDDSLKFLWVFSFKCVMDAPRGSVTSCIIEPDAVHNQKGVAL